MTNARRFRLRNWKNAFLLIAPFTLLYLMFFLYPTLRVVQLSLTDSTISTAGKFVGFENYVKLIHAPLFWGSIAHTFYFVALTVIPITAVGLGMALIVTRLKSLKGTALSVFFLPQVLPVSVVILLWQWFMNPKLGLVHFLLGGSQDAFGAPGSAMPAVALVTLWWTVGFSMLLFISGLQNISKEYYEAASLDGATPGQVFTHITWPLLWPVTALVLTLQLIAQLKIFAQVYLLTGGGPFNSTIVLLVYMYRQAFEQYRIGYGAAISMVVFVVILVTSFLQYRLLRTGDTE